MSYDKAALKAAVDLMGLAPRSRQFIEGWLESWAGDALPPSGAFPGTRAQDLEPLIMITLLEPGVSAPVTYMGHALVRAMGLDLTGMDWIRLAPPELRGERLRRANTIGAGAILRTTREVVLNYRTPYFFETISVPLRPDADGRVALVHFADWAPPEEGATVLHGMRSSVPEVAEVVPLAADGTAVAIARRSRRQREPVKIIARAAIRFLRNLLIRRGCPNS